MFSLADFGRMIADRARLDAHAAAFRRIVTPRSVVLDIGAGTGIMSLLACEAGARRVYAIEPSGAVQILLAAARDNGFADRVVVVQQRSTDVTLPERADVIISDLRGVLPAHGTHFADIADARRRHLAPGGRLLPARDTLWLAVVAAPEEFARRQAIWRSAPEGLDLRSALPFVANEVEKIRARADQLVAAPVRWASLDYATLDDRAVRGSAACTIARDAVAHGVVLWFDTELVDGVGTSNAPGTTDGIYGQIFFPWPEAVALRTGDRVSIDVRADPIGSDYVWTWATDIQTSGPGEVTRFRQSTFKSIPPSPESARRRAPTFAPALSDAGREALEVLEGMRAGRTLGELAQRLLAQHPERFPSFDKAHGFAAEIAERYGV